MGFQEYTNFSSSLHGLLGMEASSTERVQVAVLLLLSSQTASFLIVGMTDAACATGLLCTILKNAECLLPRVVSGLA